MTGVLPGFQIQGGKLAKISRKKGKHQVTESSLGIGPSVCIHGSSPVSGRLTFSREFLWNYWPASRSYHSLVGPSVCIGRVGI